MLNQVATRTTLDELTALENKARLNEHADFHLTGYIAVALFFRPCESAAGCKRVDGVFHV